ncbi:MAG TPA: transcriptional repressor [Candidatus Saccharibacteria bacterium]|nr:transcriptional repressor [Candidatus Saccharibacteria bacterium]
MNTRTTPQIKAVVEAITQFGHATNAQLLREIQRDHPTISATTVHRITSRLYERGHLTTAPADANGAMRYDHNLAQHDHFICDICGGIRDIDVASTLIPTISKALGGCKISGRLVIRGSCENCNKRIERKHT